MPITEQTLCKLQEALRKLYADADDEDIVEALNDDAADRTGHARRQAGQQAERQAVEALLDQKFDLVPGLEPQAGRIAGIQGQVGLRGQLPDAGRQHAACEVAALGQLPAPARYTLIGGVVVAPLLGVPLVMLFVAFFYWLVPVIVGPCTAKIQ